LLLGIFVTQPSSSPQYATSLSEKIARDEELLSQISC